MPLFLLRRGLAALLLVFAVTSGALLLAQLAPGDYAGDFGLSRDQIAAERHRLGLDRPFAAQYGGWLKRTLTLDFGESFQHRRPVLDLVRERAANTGVLAVAALALATLLGIPAGIFTGSRPGGLLPRLLRATSLVLLSVPPLISSLVLLTIAARTGWLPVSGAGGVSHLVVPTLALALPVAAMLERLQAQSIGDALNRPSVAAARARGIPGLRIVWRHGWRQSLGPILAVYGVIIGSLFSGSFAVEMVTSWPGLADLMRQALMARDTYVVAGCAAAGAAFLAAGVLAADVAHAMADPRLEGAPGA
jgi:ABC-type dipeptide/oligopeptide/nickel transport system permease component